LKTKLRMLPLLVALPLLLGCAKIAKPDGWVSPIIADDTVYISLDGGELSALTGESLDEVWTFPANDEARCPRRDEKLDLQGIYGAPAVGDEAVYFGGYDGYVYALSRKAKDETKETECLWSFKTDDPVIAGPVLDGDRLYVASTDGYLYVIDPETGEETARKDTGGSGATPLLTEDGFLYVATDDGRLWKLTAATLEAAWDSPFKIKTGLLTPPVLTGEETIVVGGLGATLYGIDVATGSQRWSLDSGNWFWGEPAVHGEPGSEIVIATNLDGQVFAVDPGSGEEAWPAIDALAPIRGGAAVSETGTIVVVDNNGLVLLIAAETGETIEEVDLKEGVFASPIIRGNQAIVLSRSHDIFLVDLETGRVEEARTP